MSQCELALPLGKGGSRVFDLRDILQEAYLKPGDTAFVGGSLVEGVGNSYSDIDVHVLVDRPLMSQEIDIDSHYRVLSPSRSILQDGDVDQEVFLIHTLVPETHIKVDVEYRTYEDFDRMVARIHAIFDYAVQSPLLLTKDIDHREKAFLNRIFNSVALANETRLQMLCDKIGKERLTYLLYRWNASDFSKLIDLIGACEKSEYDRGCDLARERLITEFQAYLHLCGCTNFNRKWLLTYAAKLPVDADLLTRFKRLFLVDGYDLVHRPEEYIRATVDLVDDIMLASAPGLRRNALYPDRDTVLGLIDSATDETDDTYALAEAAYRKKAYGVAGRPTWELFASL
ncbi:MAG: nucleotidyltransferase domain-containing protein [Pseudophaeobacter sp.]|uniref:nucleotidyltransferase domain-containing protein n=1 Tax=Pseudophaeobacter sp. TaxID=1971739 RepID=UPI00329A5EAB